MRYVVMCAGKGTRWNNFLGIPKHFVEINGETLIGRTARLLKKNGINDYIITTNDERYRQYGEIIPQTNNDCEVDRFEEVEDNEICYLYGDVYYTEEALKTIINTPTNEILFFGSEMEIFGVKIVNKSLFMEHKNKVKKLFLEKKIDRCIGWEVYKSINNLPLNEYAITDRFYLINDKTDDIDCPKNYLDFKKNIEGEIKMVKCEAIKTFTLKRFDELQNLIRKDETKKEKGKVYKEDIFECNEDLAKYLMGENSEKETVAKILEVIPEKIEEVGDVIISEKPKKNKRKKKA